MILIVIVREVKTGGPAHDAGVIPGLWLVGVNGQKTPNEAVCYEILGEDANILESVDD